MVSNRNFLTSRGLVLGEILDRCFRNPKANHRLDGVTNLVNHGISTTNLNWWVYRMSSISIITWVKVNEDFFFRSPGWFSHQLGALGGTFVVGQKLSADYKEPDSYSSWCSQSCLTIDPRIQRFRNLPMTCACIFQKDPAASWIVAREILTSDFSP